jgi:transposase
MQALGRSKGGYSCKIHISVDALGNPLEFILSPGETSDCPLAPRLIEGRKPQHVLADRGYDSDANLDAARAEGAEPVIPPKANRKHPQECDYALYKERRHVECTIGKLKYFRRICTRFDKYASHFLDFIHYAATLQWLK